MADETRVIVRVNALLPLRPGEVVTVLGVPSPQFHSYFVAVRVIVISRHNRLITWVWVGFVTETIVGTNRFVYDTSGGSLWIPAPSAWTVAAALRRIARVDWGVDGVVSLGGGSSHRQKVGNVR